MELLGVSGMGDTGSAVWKAAVEAREGGDKGADHEGGTGADVHGFIGAAWHGADRHSWTAWIDSWTEAIGGCDRLRKQPRRRTGRIWTGRSATSATSGV